MAIGKAALARLWRWLREDWRGQRSLLWGILLLALTVAATTFYYQATPPIIHDPDTSTYLRLAQRIATGGAPFDVVRQPGYPLLIDVVFLFAGHGNLVALGVAQGALFVGSVVETYIVGLLILRRAWMAFAPAALLGSNLHVLSFVKPILSESLTLPLVTSMALALTLYVRRPSSARLWLLVALLLATVGARSEWVYFAPALFASLAVFAWRTGTLRDVWRRLVGGLLAVGAVTLAFAVGNALVNGFFGVTEVPAINLLGKVMQYHLAGDAPSRYATIDHIVARIVAQGSDNPNTVIRAYPPLAANHYQLAGSYAQAVVLRHPLLFGWDVWLTMLKSLSASQPFHPLPHSAWDGALRPLDALSAWTLSSMAIFIPLAIVWWALLLWSRVTPNATLQAMAALSLLVMYDLVVTSAGSYWYYPRMHTPFDPVLMLVVVGSALLAVERGVQWARRRAGVVTRVN